MARSSDTGGGRVVSTRYNSEYPTEYTHDDLGRVIEMDNNAGAAVVGPDYLFEYENEAETPACASTTISPS